MWFSRDNLSEMRNYQRKPEKGTTPLDVMERAAKLVIDNKGSSDFSIRAIAKEFNIHYSTLSRFINKKLKALDTPNENVVVQCGYARPWQVLSDTQESFLENYIQRSSEIMYGLTPIQVRQLAYQCAKKYNIKCPPSWAGKEVAGVDWFTGFLKRHPDLSVRQPEATSLARMTSFNKTNTDLFFNKLGNVYSRHSLSPSRIWNMDETGVSTVLKPNKVVTKKGVKQVGSVTSAEKGEQVTVAAAISAQGTFIPPMIIFPRKKFKDHFVRDGPVGCVGAATGSGWMTEESFVQFLKHFIKCTKPTNNDPVLLLLDNHVSHLSIEGLDLCKGNGVVLLSFPPHCSHRLQPLDISVYGPFKKMCRKGVDNWLKSNPGKTLTIYDLPNIIKDSFLISFTPANIGSGFSSPGIFPYKPDIFQETDFASSFVTDRPLTPVQSVSDDSQVPPSLINQCDNPVPGPSGLQACFVNNTFSPEDVRPFPKAGMRKVTKRGRKKRRCAILTDTPEKTALEEEKKNQVSRPTKKQGKSIKKYKGDDHSTNVRGQKSVGVKRKLQYCESSSSEEDEETYCLNCNEMYKNDEEWVQCLKCKLWSHWSCANKNAFYVCSDCTGNDNKSYSSCNSD